MKLWEVIFPKVELDIIIAGVISSGLITIYHFPQNEARKR